VIPEKSAFKHTDKATFFSPHKGVFISPD
jgi:hypothetical protein